MYETIMALPLFKGVSKDLVSIFLEKTHVEFVNYTAGEDIIVKGESCDIVRFVITGSVKVRVTNHIGNLSITEHCHTGTVLAPEYLFGLDVTYPYDVKAIGDVSIMQFSKEQYINLLQSNTIYMLNYLNYLSYHSQRPIHAIKLLGDGSFQSQLALWIMTFTASGSTNIEVQCDWEDLLKMTRHTEEEMIAAIRILSANNLISMSENSISIRSRRDLIDYVTSNIESSLL